MSAEKGIGPSDVRATQRGYNMTEPFKNTSQQIIWYIRPGPKSKIQNISDWSLQQVQWYIPEFVIELEHPVVDVDFIELHVADQVCEYVRHLEAGGGSGTAVVGSNWCLLLLNRKSCHLKLNCFSPIYISFGSCY